MGQASHEPAKVFSGKEIHVRQPQRYRKAVALVEDWLNDESGHDERIWPLLEEELQDNRMRCKE